MNIKFPQTIMDVLMEEARLSKTNPQQLIISLLKERYEKNEIEYEDSSNDNKNSSNSTREHIL